MIEIITKQSNKQMINLWNSWSQEESKAENPKSQKHFHLLSPTLRLLHEITTFNIFPLPFLLLAVTPLLSHPYKKIHFWPASPLLCGLKHYQGWPLTPALPPSQPHLPPPTHLWGPQCTKWVAKHNILSLPKGKVVCPPDSTPREVE